MGTGSLSGVMAKFWNQIEVVPSQHGECVMCHRIVHFQWFISCHFNFLSIKKRKPNKAVHQLGVASEASDSLLHAPNRCLGASQA